MSVLLRNPWTNFFLIAGILLSLVFFVGCVSNIEHTSAIPNPVPITSPNITITPHNTPEIYQVSPKDDTSNNPFVKSAKEKILAFSKNSSLNLTFTGITSYSYGDLYKFESGNYSFRVSNFTGRVLSMSLDGVGLESEKNTIDLAQGLIIAESYSKEKCPDFWKNEPDKIVKKISQTAKDHELSYSWREYFVLPGNTSKESPLIQGFNLLDVTLNARDGRITSYHEWYVPWDSTLNLSPGLSEKQAWEKVKTYFEDTGIGILDEQQKDNLGLVIAIDDNNTQHLAWQFAIRQNMKNSNYYGGQIIVDAHNGQIVRHIQFG